MRRLVSLMDAPLYELTKRARLAGLPAKLIVDADAGDKELVVAAGRGREYVAADRSTGVRHADDAVAEAEVVAVAVNADPQPFELDGQVIGPGVLDTGAEHPHARTKWPVKKV